jgi:hypothetical protein
MRTEPSLQASCYTALDGPLDTRFGHFVDTL